MKKGRLICVVIGVFVTLLVVANLPFAKDLGFYWQMSKENTSDSYKRYISKYPSGIKIEDAWSGYIMKEDSSMTSLAEYLNAMPEGEQYSSILKIYDGRWDTQIEKYNNRDSKGSKNEDPDAVAYVEDMLRYMKSNRVNTLVVDIKSELKLKDYDTYSDMEKLITHLLCGKWEESKMISITENFSSADNSILQQIIVDGIQKSFNRIFSPDFISVVGRQSLTNANSLPYVIVNYSICNQEDVFGTDKQFSVPQIWVYTVDKVIQQNFLIGINIIFNAKFCIPNSYVQYSYIGNGHPEEDLNDVKDIRNGYRMMTQICFAKFSNEISKNLGLKEVYFQEE